MKRQKHYTSITQIEKDIERAQNQRDKFRRQASYREESAETLIRGGGTEDQEFIKNLQDEARKLHRKADRVENVRLVKLKRAHAAFNTRLLPGVDHDGSVTIENLPR